MFRQAVLATGLALTASLGLTGVGAASAASPALHIKPGSQWTLEINRGGCEGETFHSNFTFTGQFGGDKGTWSGGGSTLHMTWTAGGHAGWIFTDSTFTTTAVKEYKGVLTGGGNSSGAEVVKGASCS